MAKKQDMNRLPCGTTCPMTPDHPMWDAFIARLEGPEGCDFRHDEEGHAVWTCDNTDKRPLARAILAKMGFREMDIMDSMEYFDRLGGHCDCEIVFNVWE